MRAVVIDTLKKRERSGDCFYEANRIGKEIEQYPLFYRFGTEYVVKESLSSLSQEAQLHFNERLVQRQLGDELVYYLQETYDDEIFVADTIEKLIQQPRYNLDSSMLEAGLEDSVSTLASKIKDRFDKDEFLKERKHLYKKMLNSHFFVLSGSPGAGKSYELLKLVNFLRASESHRVLSLTGKAVLRLKNNDENIRGVNASTIDKFLYEIESQKEEGARPIIHNLIIDECSMIDLPKFAKLLRLIDTSSPSFRRLILVGDENQLPPIGFGKPYSDITDFLKRDPEKYQDNYICLDTNCRAELPETFINFTKAFSAENKNAESLFSTASQEGEICDGGINIQLWKNREELFEKLKLNLNYLLDGQGDLQELLGISEDKSKKPIGLENFQVISPYNAGFYGVSGLNLFFQRFIF